MPNFHQDLQNLRSVKGAELPTNALYSLLIVKHRFMMIVQIILSNQAGDGQGKVSIKFASSG